MSEVERVCAYLEAMAKKVGGDVQVYIQGKSKYMMHKRGEPQRAVRVKLDEKRESFDEKVRWLMEGA